MLANPFRNLTEALETYLGTLDEDSQEQLREAEQYARHGDFEAAAEILDELAEMTRDTGHVSEAGELYLLVSHCYRRADELEDANDYGTEAIQCFLAAETFDRAEEVLPIVLQGLEDTDEAEEAHRLRRQVEQIIGEVAS